MPKLIDPTDAEYLKINEVNSAIIDALTGRKIILTQTAMTEQQTWDCLRVANLAYKWGFEAGKKAKAKEFRELMEVE